MGRRRTRPREPRGRKVGAFPVAPGKTVGAFPASLGNALGVSQRRLQLVGVNDRLVGKRLGLVDLASRYESARLGHVVRPRQVAVDAAGLAQVRVVGHLGENPLEVGALVEAVELGGDDDGVDRGRRLGAPDRVGKQEILSPMY